MYSVDTDRESSSEREELILKHLPQVRLIARRIHERLPESVALDDLISIGVIGLIAAIDKYDPAQNVQLNTYAEYKIRGAILDSLRNLDWASRETRQRSKKIEAGIARARQKLHREPMEDEIAVELGIALEEYQKWLTEVQGIDLEGLSYASGDNENMDRLLFIADDQANLPSYLFERSELEGLLAGAIDRMPKLESSVLSLYYEQELTLREIAEVMHASLSRVAQLKTQAVLRLRQYMQQHSIERPRRN